MKDSKHIQSFNKHQKNLNSLYDKVSNDTKADRDRIVASNFRGKLSFYELDINEEKVLRYLTTISINDL